MELISHFLKFSFYPQSYSNIPKLPSLNQKYKYQKKKTKSLEPVLFLFEVGCHSLIMVGHSSVLKSHAVVVSSESLPVVVAASPCRCLLNHQFVVVGLVVGSVVTETPG